MPGFRWKASTPRGSQRGSAQIAKRANNKLGPVQVCRLYRVLGLHLGRTRTGNNIPESYKVKATAQHFLKPH